MSPQLAARPFLAELGADPGALPIAFTMAAPNGARIKRDSLRVLADETVRLGEELGHLVEEVVYPIDRTLFVPTF
jgi:hypothetical protein